MEKWEEKKRPFFKPELLEQSLICATHLFTIQDLIIDVAKFAQISFAFLRLRVNVAAEGRVGLDFVFLRFGQKLAGLGDFNFAGRRWQLLRVAFHGTVDRVLGSFERRSVAVR